MIGQIENVVIACIGDEVTTGEKDKDAPGILYGKIRQYLIAERFNVDFVEEIQSSRHSLAPIEIHPLSTDEANELISRFPEDASAKRQETVWKKFKEIQSLCRNDWGPFYEAEKKKLLSGALAKLSVYEKMVKEKNA
jgi:hypothetical protein